MTRPPWVEWLVDTGERLQTTDGKSVEVWEFRHVVDLEILSAWATHFRNHYCRDRDIDGMRAHRSRSDYLNDIKLPGTDGLGPSVRAGDFGEILVADYLQYVLNHWVPRIRWLFKPTKDESTKGCDLIGFQFQRTDEISPQDLMTIFEVKTCFSKDRNGQRLQDAVNGSAKDPTRIGESLNYLRQLAPVVGDQRDVERIDRFQNPSDVPFRESYGAVVLFTRESYDETAICQTDTTRILSSKKKGATSYPHPNRDALLLLVIRGEDMMKLVHDLYRRCADEA